VDNSDTLDALLARYEQEFGEPPLEASGISEEELARLIREALAQGRPIPEDDYFGWVPPDADA
jgi:hypothetical protein